MNLIVSPIGPQPTQGNPIPRKTVTKHDIGQYGLTAFAWTICTNIFKCIDFHPNRSLTTANLASNQNFKEIIASPQIWLHVGHALFSLLFKYAPGIVAEPILDQILTLCRSEFLLLFGHAPIQMLPQGEVHGQHQSHHRSCTGGRRLFRG